VGSTSHLHKAILQTIRALASIYNLHNNELYKESIKLLIFYKIFLKKLKDVKHEKDASIDSLKSENTVLIENIKSLENELKDSKELSNRLSSDNLENMFFVLKHVSNKPRMIIDNLGASNLHASNFEIKSLFVKHVEVEEVNATIVCLDKGKTSFMNNCLKPKSKAQLGKQTQTKSVPTCHHCGIVGHIRPNYC
jgi:hypothetical protein